MDLKNKKVIVTGGAGVIGRELIEKFVTRGARVRAFDIAPRPPGISDRVEYSQRDLSQLNPLEFTQFNPDYIFHLAAVFERTAEEPDFWPLNFRNEVMVNHLVFDAAKDCKELTKIIFASSYLIYDPKLYLVEKPPRTARLLKEDLAINPRNLCGATKLFGEKQLEYFSHFPLLYRFSSISARIFRVYGRGSCDVVSRWVRSALQGEKIEVFLKENFFDYIFAGDVAEALIQLAEKDRAKGVVNLGTGKASRIESVVKSIQKAIPDLRVNFVSKKDFFEASVADMAYFAKLTGWMPHTSLDEGIRMIIEHEKQILG